MISLPTAPDSDCGSFVVRFILLPRSALTSLARLGWRIAPIGTYRPTGEQLARARLCRPDPLTGHALDGGTIVKLNRPDAHRRQRGIRDADWGFHFRAWRAFLRRRQSGAPGIARDVGRAAYPRRSRLPESSTRAPEAGRQDSSLSQVAPTERYRHKMSPSRFAARPDIVGALPTVSSTHSTRRLASLVDRYGSGFRCTRDIVHRRFGEDPKRKG